MQREYKLQFRMLAPVYVLAQTSKSIMMEETLLLSETLKKEFTNK